MEKRDTMAFGLAISEIRRALERIGYYLSGRGQNGSQFIILPPENNQDIMQSYGRAAADSIARAIALGSTTRTELLGVEERRKHESILEKMAVRQALMQRSGQIAKLVKKHSPQLLKQGQ